MDEGNPEKENGKKLEILTAIVLIIITAIAVIYLMFPTDSPQEDDGYTKFYTTISAQEASDLINSSINTTYNLSVIDVRGLEGCGTCQFRKDGHLPKAELNSNPHTLFNTTKDILVYSKNGTEGAKFCEQLVGNVYGKIYNLKGGFETWKKEGFEVVKGA